MASPLTKSRGLANCPPISSRAFTLLEILIVAAIIGILATLLLSVYGRLRSRAQKVQCIANLHALYVATDLYIQRNGSWPQIYLKNYPDSEDYANAWVAALAPFGIERKTWICPTVEELLQNPDFVDPAHARIDYISTGFDDKPTSPHEWPRQPWFAERADVHGNGNLLIFTDGSVSEGNSLVTP